MYVPGLSEQREKRRIGRLGPGADVRRSVNRFSSPLPDDLPVDRLRRLLVQTDAHIRRKAASTGANRSVDPPGALPDSPGRRANRRHSVRICRIRRTCPSGPPFAVYGRREPRRQMRRFRYRTPDFFQRMGEYPCIRDVALIHRSPPEQRRGSAPRFHRNFPGKRASCPRGCFRSRSRPHRPAGNPPRW